AWISIGRDRHVLNTLDSGYVMIERSGDSKEYEAHVYRPGRGKKGRMFIKHRVPFKPTNSLDFALRAVETHAAMGNLNCSVGYLRRAAPWRSRPATEKQIKYCLRLGMQALIDVARDDQLEEDGRKKSVRPRTDIEEELKK